MMQLSQVSEAVKGQLIGQDAFVQGVSTNTRDACDERLFIALKGENFDAHDFLPQAEHAGATAAMLDRVVETTLPTILVDDTHQALKDMAAWWRAQFVIPLVGVTGSVGKTTVKEMLGAIFAELGKGVVTQGNLNNEIGVPLTLLRLQEGDRYAVIEMGMNHRGEISRITHIARPTIALVNNAAAAHLEGLGSIEAVAQAKGEIFEGLSADGVAVINADDRFAATWKEMVGARKVITFGLHAEADVTADYQQHNDALEIKVAVGDKSKKIQLQTMGEHNVRNALAAVAVAVAANIPLAKIKHGLEAYRPIGGRLNVHRIGAKTLIDDTYNANPASMAAAIAVLSDYADSCLITGDMGELGDSAEAAHRELGRLAARSGIAQLYACGEFAPLVAQSFGEGAFAFAQQDQLIQALTNQFNADAVLVKGSRSAKMERVVQALTEQFQDAAASRAGGH